MPELPEVETIRRQLEDKLVGQRILSVEVRREKSFVGNPEEVVGRKIEEFARKAKVTSWKLSGGKYLLVHLKMTGQLVYVPNEGGRVVGGHPTPDWVGELPSKHTRVVLELDGGVVYFNDVRVFGWIKVGSEEDKKMEFGKYGVDVIGDKWSVSYLQRVLASSRRVVKLILLDQKKIGGLGNIYANDGLFHAGINPQTRGVELARDQKRVKRLWESINHVIQKGLRYGGASERNYVHVDGLGGKYQDHFLVYGGGECKKCGKNLSKEKIGGRSTWWCERCQRYVVDSNILVMVV